MLPQQFINRIQAQKHIDAELLLTALEKPSDVSVRINRAKWTSVPEAVEEVPWCKDAFYLKIRPSYTLDPLFHGGAYYPQEASGIFLEEIFRQCINSGNPLKVLDLCGAPGGKSTHLSTLIGNRGFLVANEVIRQRASVLAENLTKWGLSNAIVTRSDPASFQNLPGFFDLVLVDAPCSGEGMFRDQVAVDEWSVENTAHCSERQKRILMDVWPSLKEDGILIYSTCTFNPDENEKNIKWLIDNKEAESVKLIIGRFPGIKEIDYEGILGYGFYPGSIKGEGLFYSVIRKKETEQESDRKIKPDPEFRTTGEQIRIAVDWTNFNRESFINISDSVFSIPCTREEFSLLSKHLFIVNPGTQIFSTKGKDALPSHELALSVFLKNTTFPYADLSLEQAIDYLRKDNITVRDFPSAWIIARYKGISLGFMKNIGNRVNNYYPTDWRIRMNRDNLKDMVIIEWKYGKEKI